jgi:hypothetical protein
MVSGSSGRTVEAEAPVESHPNGSPVVALRFVGSEVGTIAEPAPAASQTSGVGLASVPF